MVSSGSCICMTAPFHPPPLAYKRGAGRAATNCAHFASARGQLAVVAIGRRHVEIQCAQHDAAGVADFMLLAALDQQQPSRAELAALLSNGRRTAALEHEEPLVRAAMAIARPAFGI